MKTIIMNVFLFMLAQNSGAAGMATLPEIEQLPTKEEEQRATPPVLNICGKCECAAFHTETPSDADRPILAQAPMHVHCNEEGKKKCQKLCIALAQAAGEQGPQMLCSLLDKSNHLKPSIHSRICSAPNWSFTGLSAPTEICCSEGKVVVCKEQADTSGAKEEPKPSVINNSL